MVRWPGKIPAGVVTEQCIAAVDWYRTFATIAGAADKVPDDRPIDSVDTSEFLLGNSKTSGREYVLLAGNDGDMMSVKYGDIKVIFRYAEGIDKPIVKPQWPLVFDLSSDPGEKFNLMITKLDMMWMFAPAFHALGEYKASLAKYPNIKPGEDFAGYGGDAAHDGHAPIAGYEVHHHAR
jgi:arylsulfatase